MFLEWSASFSSGERHATNTDALSENAKASRRAIVSLLCRYHAAVAAAAEEEEEEAVAATEDDTFEDEEEEVEEDAFMRSLRASSDLLMAMDSASRYYLTRCCGPPRAAPRSPPATYTRVKH